MAKRVGMRNGLTSSAGTKSEIGKKCVEGRRSRGEHTFESKN